ncbi:MAG: hypothetical protein QOE13_2997 [Gaiellaceae bacterium]|nr:hypothetical protein [Gaiellaceae bacterium]
MATPGRALFIDPMTRHFEQDRLFEPRASGRSGENNLVPWVFLRDYLGSRGVPVHTVDLLESGQVPPAEKNVYVSLGIRHRYARLARRPNFVLSGFFALECPIVEPRLYQDLDEASSAFKRVFSISTAESLRPFLREPLNVSSVRLPQPQNAVHDEHWHRNGRKFLTIINANKLPRLYVRELYTERLRAVEYFNRRGEIDLYGVGWDEPPVRVGQTRVPGTVRRLERLARTRWERRRPPGDPLRVAAREAYRGSVASKAETLAGYTFAICFENMVLEGWITEKIFDCLLVGTVPIYLGAPDIDKWVPPECFVDMRQFRDYDELRNYLVSLRPDEIEAFREAGRDYLQSDRFRPFTKEAFAELMARIVVEDTGAPL